MKKQCNTCNIYRTTIHPFSVTAYPCQGCGRLEPIPADVGREVRYTLDKTFTPKGNLESPINPLSESGWAPPCQSTGHLTEANLHPWLGF